MKERKWVIIERKQLYKGYEGEDCCIKAIL